MKFIDIFKVFFKSDENFTVKESFNTFELQCNTNNLRLPSREEFDRITEFIPTRDNFFIFIECDEYEICRYSKDTNIDEFLENLKVSLEDEDDENYSITLKIDKLVNEGNLTIYDAISFTSFLEELKLHQILYNFNRFILEYGGIYFRSCEVICGDSDSIHFLKENEPINFRSSRRSELITMRSQITTYLNSSEYDLVAEDFIFYKKTNNDNINNVFYKLSVLYSIIGISDVSIIKDDKLKLIINGYRRIEAIIDYNGVYDEKLNEYLKVYTWIYDNNINNYFVDKVGIARNVISSSINENNILNGIEGLFNSICSAHSIYLKENVKEYLEVKAKVTEFLFDLSSKMSELSNEIGKAMLNNIIAFLGVYIGIFITSAFSEGHAEIFSKDISYMSLLLLIGSCGYLLLSIWEEYSEYKRYKEIYDRFKKSYNDVLDNNDIDLIFKEDEYLKNDKKYIIKKSIIYILIWIVVLVALFSFTYNRGYEHLKPIMDNIMDFFI